VINPSQPPFDDESVDVYSMPFRTPNQTSGPGFDFDDEDREIPAPTPEELEAVRQDLEEQVTSGTELSLVAGRLLALRPPDQATIVSQLEPETCTALLTAMTSAQVADFIEYMDAEAAITFSQLVPPVKLAEVLDLTEPDVAADVLRGMGWDEASRILMRMTDRQTIGNLLLYRDDDAGGLMTTSVLALRDTWPTPHAINMLRT
jgi:Mg/Co/Ni transporter MgtE